MRQGNRGNEYHTSRKVYKDVKKYDHQQFDDFCTIVYSEGWKDGSKAGQASVPGVDIEDVMTAIRSVKGIGEKRLEQIRTEVEKLFGERKEEKAG